MKKVSEAFSWTPPLAWEEKRRGVNLVYRLPERELVISFWAVKDGLKPEKQAAALQALMDTALKAIEKDSKNPNLQPSVPLTRVDENDLEFWVQSLATKDGTVGISTAAVRGHSGVLLATMEAPTRPDHFPVFVEFLRSIKALAVIALMIWVSGLAMAASPADDVVPPSAYRKYIWAARDAYERRDFAETQKLLKAYEDLGSPGDKMLEAAGCDPALGVRLLSSALAQTTSCLRNRLKSARWTSDQIDQAETAVVNALKSGASASLTAYLDCAPADMTGRASFCHTPRYPSLTDFKKFMIIVRDNPDVIAKLEWRDVRLSWDSPSHAQPSVQDLQKQGFTAIDDGGHKWILYTASPQWHPCDMTGVPLLALREDKNGDVRISGFAASCLELVP